MKDDVCVIEVGTHPGPYWIDTNVGPVCARHRAQYEERSDEFGPFDWKPFVPAGVAPEAAKEGNQ